MRRVRFIFVCLLTLVASFGCRTPAPRPSLYPSAVTANSAVKSIVGNDMARLPSPSTPPRSQVIVTPVSFEDLPLGKPPAEPVVAQPVDHVPELSLEGLIAEVQSAHPSVEAMYAAWQAAVQRYPQVTSLEDPMFGLTAAPASFGSNTVSSAYVLEASQKLPWFGKRALRGAAANAEADGASLDLETTRQKLAEVTEIAYWELYVARQQLELNDQNAALLRLLRDNALNRYQTGLVTQQDVLQAQIEMANLEQRHIELVRMDQAAAGRINSLLRRNATYPLPALPKSKKREIRLPDQESLIAWAVEMRPDVSASAARIQAEQAKLALAQKQFYPDTEFFGRYDSFWQPASTQGDLRAQVGMRLNLPIYRGRLNAGVCEAMHQLTKARAEYEQLVLEVQNDVQSAFAQVREAQNTVALYTTKTIPAAEQYVAVARANYDNSKTNFLDLANAQRQLIEARERLLQAQVEMQRRTAVLRRVSGGSLPEATPAEKIPTP